MLVPLALILLASFSGPIVRLLCVSAAVGVSIWIFYDTELAKGTDTARHSRPKRIGRTVAAAVVLALVGGGVLWGSNRLQAFAENWGKSETSVSGATSASHSGPSMQGNTQAPKTALTNFITPPPTTQATGLPSQSKTRKPAPRPLVNATKVENADSKSIVPWRLPDQVPAPPPSRPTGPTYYRNFIISNRPNTLEVQPNANFIANTVSGMDVKAGSGSLVYKNDFEGAQWAQSLDSQMKDQAELLKSLNDLHDQLRRRWTTLKPDALQEKENMFDAFVVDVESRVLDSVHMQSRLMELGKIDTPAPPIKSTVPVKQPE